MRTFFESFSFSNMSKNASFILFFRRMVKLIVSSSPWVDILENKRPTKEQQASLWDEIRGMG